MASPETLNVSGVATKGGWTGTDGDVFEAIAAADGNLLINRQNEGDGLLLDIDDSEVVDGDTVTNISINIRCARGANSNDSVTAQLFIGGSPIGVAQDFASQGGTLANGTLSNSGNLNDPTAGTGWNEDRTEAEMDGMQVELVPTQGGMPDTVIIDFDCLDVIVTFTSGGTTFFQTLGATAIGSAGLKRLTSKGLDATAIGSAGIVKQTSKGLAATALGVATLNAATLFTATLDAIAIGVATLATKLTFGKILNAVALGVAGLSTIATHLRTLAASAVGVAGITKKTSKTLAAVAVGAAGLTKGTSKTLAATAIGVAGLAAATVIGQALNAIAVGITTLGAVFIAASVLVSKKWRWLAMRMGL